MKITDIEVNESIELGDNFDIELGNTIIESSVVGFMDDGVVLEADDKALALLGIGGALLESVDITEVSLGDYSKKAQISRALAQIDQKFHPDKPGSEQTIAKRTRGLERAKVRSDQAKAQYAAQAQQARADAVAKDRENLPTLEKYLAQLKAEFDPDYEYSDDHSVWTKNKDLQTKISNLENRIKAAKGVTEGDDDSFTKPAIIMRASPKAMAKAQEILQKQADKNVISMAKIAGTTPAQGVAEGSNIPFKITSNDIKSYTGGFNVDIDPEKVFSSLVVLCYHKFEDLGIKDFGAKKSIPCAVEIFKQYFPNHTGDIQNFVRKAYYDYKEAGTFGESHQGVAEGMERGEYSRVLGALGLYYPRLSMEELNVPGYHKVIANKANVPVEYAAQVINDFVRATEPEDEDWMQDDDINEAKYQGREVPLGKPMQGDVKKSKVYVRGPKGNVVKVNFGDKNMRIKKSNPKRRKSFRARHNCANPGPRWKARYWSCRAW